MNELMNQSINYEGVYRTAPATPGLLTMGQMCPIVFLDLLTFSPGLENKKTAKCGSESFPLTVTYILCVENY